MVYLEGAGSGLRLGYPTGNILGRTMPKKAIAPSWLTSIFDLKILVLFFQHATTMIVIGFSTLVTKLVLHLVLKGCWAEAADFCEDFFLLFLFLWFMWQVIVTLWNERVKVNGTQFLSLVA